MGVECIVNYRPTSKIMSNAAHTLFTTFIFVCLPAKASIRNKTKTTNNTQQKTSNEVVAVHFVVPVCVLRFIDDKHPMFLVHEKNSDLELLLIALITCDKLSVFIVISVCHCAYIVHRYTIYGVQRLIR